MIGTTDEAVHDVEEEMNGCGSSYAYSGMAGLDAGMMTNKGAHPEVGSNPKTRMRNDNYMFTALSKGI